MPFSTRGRISLRAAFLLGLCATLLVGLLPAALVLDRRLSAELERRAREELLRAPMVLKDRNAARAEALAMHADVVAATPALAEAMQRGDRTAAVTAAAGAVEFPGETPVVVDPDGAVWIGPAAAAAARGSRTAGGGGASSVVFVPDTAGPQAVALTAVPAVPGAAAGVAALMDEATAATLAALTRSDVVVFDPDGRAAARSGDSTAASELARLAPHWSAADTIREVELVQAPHWVVTSPLGDAGGVAFLRAVGDELAVIPDARRAVLLAGAAALLFAATAGLLYALVLARPVRQLATAAGRLAEGDFAAPLPRSAITEVQQVASAFDSMRAALSARLEELRQANRTLQERQRRLEALQTELIRQDRLVASGRLVAELTHEIRNPVANVRNCIELVRRRVAGDPEARTYADMAVDELLRMHRLAEQLLDLHRPAPNGDEPCDAAAVLREIAALACAGTGRTAARVQVDAPESLAATIPRDALRQVLLNLVENSREAAGDRGSIILRGTAHGNVVRIEVLDDGPGISEEVLPRIFDPFFTTKGAVSGVGLGLFVAEGIVRQYGGRLQAENRPEGGTRLVMELLRVPEEVPT